jgi:hypothetical protein
MQKQLEHEDDEEKEDEEYKNKPRSERIREEDELKEEILTAPFAIYFSLHFYFIFFLVIHGYLP